MDTSVSTKSHWHRATVLHLSSHLLPPLLEPGGLVPSLKEAALPTAGRDGVLIQNLGPRLCQAAQAADPLNWGGPQQCPNLGSGSCTGVPRSSGFTNQPLVPRGTRSKASVGGKCLQGPHVESSVLGWGQAQTATALGMCPHREAESRGSKVVSRREGMCVNLVQRSGMTGAGAERARARSLKG